MPTPVLTMDRPAALVARLVREVIRDVSGRTPKTPFTATEGAVSIAAADPPAGWLLQAANDTTTTDAAAGTDNEICPVCLEDAVLPLPPCAVAAAVEGTDAGDCDAMCMACVARAVSNEITDRVYGVAPVRCPGTCRRPLPAAAWSVYVASGSNAATVEATIEEMRQRRARGGDIAQAMMTKTDGAAVDAPATSATSTTATAAATTTEAAATVPPRAWNEFNSAAERVTRLRCPACDETRSWIDDVERLGRDEVAGDAQAAERRAACYRRIEAIAKGNEWFNSAMLASLRRTARRFARYEAPASDLADCVAVLAFGPDHAAKRDMATSTRCWEDAARDLAWRVLSLCPDPERRASLALALVRVEPRVTIEQCCWMTVCIACQAEDAHHGMTCEEHQGVMGDNEESGVRSCPECGVALFRSEGCDDITCAACSAVFDWNEADRIA